MSRFLSPLSEDVAIPIWCAMQDDDDTECVGECNFVVSREMRQGRDGRSIIEEIERCTRCGYVVARQVSPEPRPDPKS